MADIMPSHHGEDESDELLRHQPSIVPTNCESVPPLKRRQHYKPLTVYQLYNKLRCLIPIQYGQGNILCSWRVFRALYLAYWLIDLTAYSTVLLVLEGCTR